MVHVWMSELSQRSAVPVPTIKYYLREGLLPPGHSVGATRAVYDEAHVQRLRLVRALVEIAGMRLDQVREVVAALEDETESMHQAVGRAHVALSVVAVAPSETASARVTALIEAHGWQVDPHGNHARALAAALDQIELTGHPLTDHTLDVYADAATTLAAEDLAGMPRENRPGAAAYAVIGTLLTEPVLVYLRRMAQEDASARMFG